MKSKQIEKKEESEQAAKFTVQKSKSINIRLAQKDVAKIKAMAARHGLPYQTFITSVLHKISADR